MVKSTTAVSMAAQGADPVSIAAGRVKCRRRSVIHHLVGTGGSGVASFPRVVIKGTGKTIDKAVKRREILPHGGSVDCLQPDGFVRYRLD